MNRQAQPPQLLQRLSQELGVNPQELQERARHSKLGQAATMAAIQDGCDCRACRFLRGTVDGLMEEAMEEIAPPPVAAPVPPVEG